MERRRLTKKDIVDLIVAEATNKLFTGDSRDGDTPPITIQNFNDEMMRHGARALRARLSRLSLADLVNEGVAAFKYGDARQERIQQYVAEAKRNDRDAAAQRQAELARRPRLQSPILEAARHYRRSNFGAKRAWREIEKSPYVARTGEIVVVDDDKLWVEARDGKRKRAGIKLAQWQKRYWPDAEPDFR